MRAFTHAVCFVLTQKDWPDKLTASLAKATKRKAEAKWPFHSLRGRGKKGPITPELYLFHFGAEKASTESVDASCGKRFAGIYC